MRPRFIDVFGAGTASANGRYAHDGDYEGNPRYVCGDLCILRYTMPTGNLFWYITSKDVDKDAGDLYRVRSQANSPPCDAAWTVAKDGVLPAPRLSPAHHAVAPAATAAEEAARAVAALSLAASEHVPMGLPVASEPVLMGLPVLPYSP